jgi:hypothetical protein
MVAGTQLGEHRNMTSAGVHGAEHGQTAPLRIVPEIAPGGFMCAVLSQSALAFQNLFLY